MKIKVCYLFELLMISLALATSAAHCQGCPTDIPDNSALNSNGLPSSWAANAQITAWIDTSAIPPGTNLYAGVVQSLTAYNTFLQQSGGNLTILTGSGMPLVLAQPTYYLSVGTVQPGKDATTQWANDSTGTVFSSTTLFSSDFQTQNNNGTLTQAQAAGLEGHEMAQPFGLGDCTLPDCTSSISEDNGNILPGPSTCDQARIAQVRSAIAADYPAGTGLGSGDGASCNYDPPNDTCVCDETNTYSCQCDGSPSTCDDGTSAICYEGAWTCGTVSTSQCSGTAPCTGAICVNNTWDTSSCNGCTDVCNSSCSNYDPTQCACESNACYSSACSSYDYCTCNPDDPSCQAGSCDPNDPDECDPNSCFYDYWQCFVDCGCEDLCGYLAPVMGVPSDLTVPVDADPNLLPHERQVAPSIRSHPMCDVRPFLNGPQTRTPGAYVAGRQTQERLVEWTNG